MKGLEVLKNSYLNICFFLLLFFGRLIFCTSCFGQSLYNMCCVSENELSRSNSFNIILPLVYNQDSCTITLVCERFGDNTVDVVDVKSSLVLPKEFFRILLENFTIRNQISYWDDYDKLFDYYRCQGFIDTSIVSFDKQFFRKFEAKSIYIVDLDKDGFDDILLLNLQESMRDNNVYEMFQGTKNRIVYKKNFFKNRAFYGWDGTGEYLITGISDTKERRFYKNLIKGNRLIVVDRCIEYAVADEFCW